MCWVLIFMHFLDGVQLGQLCAWASSTTMSITTTSPKTLLVLPQMPRPQSQVAQAQ